MKKINNETFGVLENECPFELAQSNTYVFQELKLKRTLSIGNSNETNSEDLVVRKKSSSIMRHMIMKRKLTLDK